MVERFYTHIWSTQADNNVADSYKWIAIYRNTMPWLRFDGNSGMMLLSVLSLFDMDSRTLGGFV